MVEKLTVDPKTAEKYARAQCSDARIAAACNISETTLKRRVGPQLSVWRLAGQADLQLAQWVKALKYKDTAMLKHLGKHILGQHDQMQLIGSTEPEVRKLLSHWDEGKYKSIATTKPMSQDEEREVDKPA